MHQVVVTLGHQNQQHLLNKKNNKMKYNYKIIFLVFITAIFTSCNNNDNEMKKVYPNSGWIEIDSSTLTDEINYDEGTYEIPLLLNSATNTNGIMVNYVITLDSGNLSDQSILGTKSTMISMDEDTGIISFDPVYNEDSYYTLKFTLSSTDDSEFLIGLNDGSQPTEFLLTITNKKMYDASPSAFGASAPTYVAEVGRIDESTFEVNSTWGPNFVSWATGNPAYDGLFLNAGTLLVDASNNLTVSGDFISTTGSFGTYDPLTGILDFTFNEDGLFNNGFATNTVMTPQ